MKSSIVKCKTCHNETVSFASRKRIFCSWQCYRASNHRHGLRELVCKRCGNSFFQKSNNQQLCGSIKNKLGCSYLNCVEQRTTNHAQRQRIRDRKRVRLCKKCEKPKIVRISETGIWLWFCPTCSPNRKTPAKKSRPLRLRFKTLKRYGFTCQYCGRMPPVCTLQIDHIVPRSRGGKTVEENLTVSCAECNLGKSDVLL